MNFVHRAAGLGAVIVLGLILLAAPVLAETPAESASRIQERYKSIEAISANYTRKSKFAASGSIFKSEVQGGGWIAWAKPYSLHLDQRTPKRELIVTTSQGIWWCARGPQPGGALPPPSSSRPTCARFGIPWAGWAASPRPLT